MEFFGMDDSADTPTKNRPNYAFMTIGEHKQKYFQETFDQFINEYVLGNNDADESEPGDEGAHTDDAGALEMFFSIFLCQRTIIIESEQHPTCLDLLADIFTVSVSNPRIYFEIICKISLATPFQNIGNLFIR